MTFPVRSIDDLDVLRDEYARDGVVLVRDLFTQADIDDITAAVDLHIGHTVPSLTRDVHFEKDGVGIRVVNELQTYQPYFASLLARDRLVAAVGQIAGWTPMPMYAEFFPKVPGGAVANPHQDTAFETVRPHQYLHVWIALTDIAEDMGPLMLWPGSQRDEPLPHDQRDFSGFQYISPGVLSRYDYHPVQAIMRSGDALIFDTGVIHASSHNSSKTARRAVALAYRGAGTRHEEARS